MIDRNLQRISIALALAVLTSSAIAETLPLRPGFYARADRACATHGDAGAYADLLHLDDRGLSDTGHARRIAHVREENGALVVEAWSDNLANGGEPASLSWVVRVMGPETFVMLGADRGVDWSGQWRWCGEAIP